MFQFNSSKYKLLQKNLNYQLQYLMIYLQELELYVILMLLILIIYVLFLQPICTCLIIFVSFALIHYEFMLFGKVPL